MLLNIYSKGIYHKSISQAQIKVNIVSKQF